MAAWGGFDLEAESNSSKAYLHIDITLVASQTGTPDLVDVVSSLPWVDGTAFPYSYLFQPVAEEITSTNKNRCSCHAESVFCFPLTDLFGRESGECQPGTLPVSAARAESPMDT